MTRTVVPDLAAVTTRIGLSAPGTSWTVTVSSRTKGAVLSNVVEVDASSPTFPAASLTEIVTSLSPSRSQGGSGHERSLPSV